MTHLGARLYDPGLGRFISVDPLMVLTDPQQMNGYAYANNNPVTFFDPTGLLCTPDGFSLCAGQDVRSQPAGKPKPRLTYGGGLNSRCVDYCGSRADNRVRRALGAPTVGMGGVIGPVEPGVRGRSLDDTAAIIFKKPYGKLTPAEKASARELTLAFNNPSAAAAIRQSQMMEFGENDDYGLGNELVGTADAHRCFANGSASGCVWFVVGVTPAKLFKFGKVFGGLFSRLFRGGAKACSFSGDTLVLMADGTTKPISQVEVGQRVLAADPDTGEQTAETVVAVWVHEDQLVDLQLTQPDRGVTDGVSAGVMVTVTTTADHPFWNHTDRQWQPATSLDPGDQLLTPGRPPDGQPTVVGLLPGTTYHGDAYNLTITNTHTYHVLAGQTPVLVHNTGPCDGDELGIAHATNRHTRGGSEVTPSAGIFDDGVDLGTLARSTAGQVGRRQLDGNVIYVLRSQAIVGVDGRTGLPTNIYTVVRNPYGELVTVYPGR